MPITADLGGKNYVLGRGRVYFDRYTAAQIAAGLTATTRGEGERYLGNTPAFGMSSSSDDLDHYSSEGGIRVKDDSVQLQLDRSGSFECDNIDAENIALYFLGDASTQTQAAATDATTVVTVKQGMFYQLGATASNPSGVRLVSNVTVGKGVGFATPVTASGNWQVDEARGRIYILPDAPDLPDDTEIEVEYDVAAGTRERVVSSTTSIYGAIRFVADNPKGANKDYYLPYVKLAPDGDFALKGDDWQKMTFTMQVLIKNGLDAAMYVDGQAVAD